VLLALPFQYLHNGAGLPGVYFPGAFPGGDADLEPDFDPARAITFRYIIADHADILTYFRCISPAIPGAFSIAAAHFSLLSLAYSAGFP